jgi:hypothetical protein
MAGGDAAVTCQAGSRCRGRRALLDQWSAAEEVPSMAAPAPKMPAIHQNAVS